MKEGSELGSKRKKIFCVISTNSNEPFRTILREGTLPSWASNLREVEVCTLECKYNSRVFKLIDSLRERNRYSAKWISRLGQALDLALLPLANFTPKATRINSMDSIDRLVIRMPEILALYRWKYIAGIRYFLESTDCDYFYTVNASCFVNEEVLLKYIHGFEKIEYAGSLISDPRHGYQFISGANRIISRETAKLIYKNRRFWPMHVLEDLGLGRLTHKLKLMPQKVPTINLTSEYEVRSLTNQILGSNFHFRLKSTTHISGRLMSRNDVELFRVLKFRLEQYVNFP